MKLASFRASFCERVAQVLELVVGGREEAAVDDPLGLLVAGQGLEGRRAGVGDGVADADLGKLLQVGRDVADLADAQLVARHGVRAEAAKAGDFVLGLLGHQEDLLADLDRAVHDADVDDDALVIVELRVEDQRPQAGHGSCRRGAGRGR